MERGWEGLLSKLGIDLLVLAVSLDKLVFFLHGTVGGVLEVVPVLLLTTLLSRILAGLVGGGKTLLLPEPGVS